MWGRGQEGTMVLAPLSTGFQSLPLLPIIKLGLSGADSRVGRLVHALGFCGSLQRPLLWGWEFVLLPPQPTQVFSIRKAPALCPCAGALGCTVCFTPPLFLPVYLCTNVGPWGATHRPACPVLCHSESGPLGLSVHKCRASGSASGQTACPIRPTLCQSQSRHSNASPLGPGFPSLPLLPVWMNVSFSSTWCRTFLPFDFLSVLVVRGGSVCLHMPPYWVF